jgi:hypothetical protein
MTSAQPNCTTSGRSNGGRPGNASDASPSPFIASNPTKTNEPIPAASKPGSSTSPSVAPPSPRSLHQQEGTEDRGPEQGADRGEAPGRSDHGSHLLRPETQRARQTSENPALQQADELEYAAAEIGTPISTARSSRRA